MFFINLQIDLNIILHCWTCYIFLWYCMFRKYYKKSILAESFAQIFRIYAHLLFIGCCIGLVLSMIAATWSLFQVKCCFAMIRAINFHFSCSYKISLYFDTTLNVSELQLRRKQKLFQGNIILRQSKVLTFGISCQVTILRSYRNKWIIHLYALTVSSVYHLHKYYPILYRAVFIIDLRKK